MWIFPEIIHRKGIHLNFQLFENKDQFTCCLWKILNKFNEGSSL